MQDRLNMFDNFNFAIEIIAKGDGWVCHWVWAKSKWHTNNLKQIFVKVYEQNA